MAGDKDKGRKGDDRLAHVSTGEIIIPRVFAEDDTFREIINIFFKENGVDLRQFIVGDKKNKTNPKTGNLEFGFLSTINPFTQFARILRGIKKGVKKLFIPEIPKFEAPKLPPKREDVPTPESELRRRAKRRGVAATLISEENILGGRGRLGG